MKVRLIGTNDEIHAEGVIHDKTLMKCSLLQRNGRLYSYQFFIGGFPVYREVTLPYIITEF